MNFSISHSTDLLGRTPAILKAWFSGLSEPWIHCNEGPETWSAFDITGHLLHGEKTDWPERIAIILSGKEERRFHPFDRFAQFEDSKGKTMNDLLAEFEGLRKENLVRLGALNISGHDLKKTGIHPALGEVTLQQLLATWVVHDLNHLAQAARVMAFQYKLEVGPWAAYLRILKG